MREKQVDICPMQCQPRLRAVRMALWVLPLLVGLVCVGCQSTPKEEEHASPADRTSPADRASPSQHEESIATPVHQLEPEEHDDQISDYARPTPTFQHQAHTIEAGRTKAASLGLPLVVVLMKHGCQSCEIFVRRHLNDPDVKSELSGTVVVRKYYDEGERERYAIDAVPLVLVYEARDGQMVFADVMKGLVGEEIVAKKVRDVRTGRNRADEAVAAAATGDEDAQFIIDRYYAPYLEPEQRAQLQR